jgi:hypothetical protein
MKPKSGFRKYALALVAVAALAATDHLLARQFPWIGAIVSDAEARVGRPGTPGSVAGVARRTTRRTIRRSSIYVATLPAACARVTINGMTLWSCGGAYYQSSGGRYVVVYVD